MKRLRVETPSRGYDIYMGGGLLDRAGELTADLCRGRAAVLTDGNVDGLYAERLTESLEKAGIKAEKLVIPAGETSKTPETLLRMLHFLAEKGFTRADTVFALGGGVVGDTAGLAAALYMRGVGLVQIPTTLLSMVDSSVGGKTAVDLPQGKNLMGAFYQPELVLCDTDTLATLPTREISCGYGEIVKYTMAFDGMLVRDMAGGMDVTDTVARCIEIKRRVTAADERDTGERRLLNFGHTFGHAVEKLSGYTLSHGEAVAVGMAIITRACVKMGICEGSCLEALLTMLEGFGLPASTPFGEEEIMKAAMTDKKRSGDKMTLALVRGVGEGFLREMTAEEAGELLHAGLEA